MAHKIQDLPVTGEPWYIEQAKGNSKTRLRRLRAKFMKLRYAPVVLK